jgi:hypothetical protein
MFPNHSYSAIPFYGGGGGEKELFVALCDILWPKEAAFLFLLSNFTELLYISIA